MTPRCLFRHNGRPTTAPGTADDAARIALSQLITRILVRDGDEAPNAYQTPGADGYSAQQMAEAEEAYTHLAPKPTVSEAVLKTQCLDLLREGVPQSQLEDQLSVTYSQLKSWLTDEAFAATWEQARRVGKGLPELVTPAPTPPPTVPQPVVAREPLEATEQELQQLVLDKLRSGQTSTQVRTTTRGINATKLAKWGAHPWFQREWQKALAESKEKRKAKAGQAKDHAEQPSVTDLPRIGQLYHHYKSGLYKLLFLGRQEATGEDVAIYASVETNQVWVRPLVEFAEPRFELVPQRVNAYEIPSAKQAREMAHATLHGHLGSKSLPPATPELTQQT